MGNDISRDEDCARDLSSVHDGGLASRLCGRAAGPHREVAAGFLSLPFCVVHSRPPWYPDDQRREWHACLGAAVRSQWARRGDGVDDPVLDGRRRGADAGRRADASPPVHRPRPGLWRNHAAGRIEPDNRWRGRTASSCSGSSRFSPRAWDGLLGPRSQSAGRRRRTSSPRPRFKCCLAVRSWCWWGWSLHEWPQVEVSMQSSLAVLLSDRLWLFCRLHQLCLRARSIYPLRRFRSTRM